MTQTETEVKETIVTFENVMIIDDTDIDTYITARIMKTHHFNENPLKFSMADEALKYLHDNRENSAAWPDVILVDIYISPLWMGFNLWKPMINYRLR